MGIRASSRRAIPSDPSVNGVLGVILDLPRLAPTVSTQRRLDALFRELSKEEPSRAPDDIEDLIWALWVNHPEPESRQAMTAAIEAMSAGALDLARPILDRLVERHPDWAEAWNKRATVAFLQKRDTDALSDILRTLELEPRHFGAVSGFAQICLRHNRLGEARAAFQIAHRLNPHLEGVEEIIRELGRVQRTLH